MLLSVVVLCLSLSLSGVGSLWCLPALSFFLFLFLVCLFFFYSSQPCSLEFSVVCVFSFSILLSLALSNSLSSCVSVLSLFFSALLSQILCVFTCVCLCVCFSLSFSLFLLLHFSSCLDFLLFSPQPVSVSSLPCAETVPLCRVGPFSSHTNNEDFF